jgi:transglutaminase-like putative cysteine protease
MRIRIHHETTYHYDAHPSHLVQRLHLTPREFATQKTLSWTITAPGIATALSYVDGFGNKVHLVTAEVEDQTYKIVAEGEVETSNTAGVVGGLTSALPNTIYLRQTDATLPDAAIQIAIAQQPVKGSVLESAHALMEFVHEKIAYEVGTSVAETTAAEAFASGRGVCQDHAHVMVGMARALGIPSRYVTGYLITGVGASSSAAHAWSELLIPDLGWVGFDAANGQCPTDHYVRLASGLDAGAVAPVKGSRRGAFGAQQLTVEVRAEIAQQ